MYYIMLLTAVIMFSFQFVFNDSFRKEEGSSLGAALKFVLYTSVFGMVLLFITNKGKIDVTLFSVLTACVYGGVCVTLSYVSFKALESANLSVYSVFSMIGGMLLPFFYGIACGEPFKTIRLVCCLLITLSVIMSAKKGAHSKKAILYYMAVFVLNGLVGVLSKFHQSYPDACVDSGSFLFLSKVLSSLFCLIFLLVKREKIFSVHGKSLVYSGLYSILNSVGNLLLLLALLHLPASVQYPMVTGGVIVISTLIVVLRKEKITKRELWAAGIAFLATVFMAI